MRTLGLLLLLASSVLASANDAYWVAVGDAGYVGKSTDVRMVSEHVQIKLSPKNIHVRVDFEFKNEGKAQKVTMAFPETVGDYTERKPTDPITITSIFSKVDGRPTPINRKTMKVPLDEYAHYSAVWLKEVPFRSQESRRVTVEYTAKLSPRDDITACYYILRSGASWKGKIGRCLITVDWSELRNVGEPKFAAAKAPISGSKPISHREIAPFTTQLLFNDFEPNFDLSIMWENMFWNYRINGSKPPSSYEVESGGPARDPWIDTSDVHSLLATDTEYDQIDYHFRPESEEDRVIRSQAIHFPDDASVSIDGKRIPLSRPIQRDGVRRKVYVKDLVQAMGGTFVYNEREGRVYITLPEKKRGLSSAR